MKSCFKQTQAQRSEGVCLVHQEAFLSNNTFEVTGRGVVEHPDRVIKTSADNSDSSHWQTEQCSENQSSQSICTSWKHKVIYYCKQHPWGEEA